MTNHANGRRELLVLLIGVLAACSCVNGQKRPPNYSQDDMPVTSFNCRDKLVGGYYADHETDCQMFHVCVRVPGVGIQNFRFLCPNETAFDQEHQICDDWYNIDCELSSLYYSDNFDLYRIGVNHEVKKPPTSHKGTPIPLGPSSTVKPWQTDIPKKNNYEDEDDYKRSGNDILRGSHSSNFYASSNRGRDDLDDNDYEAPNLGAKRQELAQNNEIKKQKTYVRKLASKRPVAPQQSAQQPLQQNTVPPIVSTAAPQRPQPIQQFNQGSYSNNKAFKTRGNVNYSSKTAIPEYQYVSTTTSTPTIFQRINNLTETERQDSEETVTPTYDLNRSYENSYNFRQQTKAFNRQKIAAPKATYSSPGPVIQAQTESIRLPSTDYLRSIAQTYQQPASYINNQLQDTGNRNNYRQPTSLQYDQYKKASSMVTKSPSPSFANYDNEYQRYVNTYQRPSSTPSNYQTTARVPQQSPIVAQNVYYESSPKPKSYAVDVNSYQSYTTPVAYSQPNTTAYDYYKYYQTSTVNVPNGANSVNRNYYSTSPATAYNLYQSTTSVSPPPKPYNPYANFQKLDDDKYDDEEFLKTAPSSNLKPSDLNAIHKQKNQLYINATLKAAYSFDQQSKSALNPQIVNSSPKAATFATKPVTSTLFVVASSPKATVYQPTKDQSPVHPTYVLPNKVVSNTNATKNQDYDYAYYDNGGGSAEYEQVDAVGEDFAKIQKSV